MSIIYLILALSDNIAADSTENLKDEPNTSDDDDFADFFYKTTETPKRIFSKVIFFTIRDSCYLLFIF